MRALFYLFLATLPFQASINPFPQVDLPIGRVFALFLGIFWLVSSLRKRGIFLKTSLTGTLLFLFLLWSFFSLFWAKEISFGLRKFLFLLNFFPLFWIVSSLKSLQESKDRVARILIGSGIIAALAGIVQFLLQFIFGQEAVFSSLAGLAPILYGKNFGQAVLAHNSWLVNIQGQTFFRAISFFPDPHIFGFYLAFVAPLALFSPRNLHKIFGVIFLFTLALTFSRGAYIGALGVLLWFFVVKIIEDVKSKIENRKIKFKILTKLFPLSILFFILIISPIGFRLLSSFDLYEGSVQGRLEIWSQALRLIKEVPLLGVGIGNYAPSIEPTASYRTPIYAHNLYLDIAAELGLIGLAIWAALIGHTLYSLLPRLKEHWLCSALFVSLVWFSIQAFFDTPLFSVHILPLFIVFLALANSTLNTSFKAKIRSTKHVIPSE